MHRALELLATAVERRQLTHGCLLVSQEGQIVVHHAVGKARLDSVFDLASLTKPLATTAAVMQLVASDDLSLDSRVADLLPSLARVDVGLASVRQLLSHSAGLAAWQPFYRQVGDLPAHRARGQIRRLAARAALAYAPGSRSLYSDLGFILLDWLVERATKKRLDRHVTERIVRPLGLTRTGFVDLLVGDTEPHRRRWDFVPTERCRRRGRLRGQVHDDNCHAMGGICGHAGLFSTAYDIHLMVREFVAAYHGQRAIYDKGVVRHFWCSQPVFDGSRALGWDRPSGVRPSGGSLFGPRSLGHLGFTGTSLWIDPEIPLYVILLTNRVYFGREPNPMLTLRPALHDAIDRALKRRTHNASRPDGRGRSRRR